MSSRSLTGRAARAAAYTLTLLTLLAGAASLNTTNVSANHPVYVEGNCDSPVFGTTLVGPGTCGDFDGDGRIGTAEDTDGADRIFGTLTAALGAGTGAAADTGINHNGKIVIVKSGRFHETLYIGQNLGGPGAPGVADPGNVTIEAAPGVEATLDAVGQGDTTANNNLRQASTGILVVYVGPGGGAPARRVVTLRNLEVRNYGIGIEGARDAVLDIDNCRIENNLHHGILGTDFARVSITDTKVSATGFRIGSSPFTVPNPGTGNGITARDSSQLRVGNSYSSKNSNFGVAGQSTNPVYLYNTQAYFNYGTTNIFGNVSNCPSPLAGTNSGNCAP